MRVAVISDIHANLHALEAVLAAIETAGVDALWCLGDTVGYGPRPNECCDLVREASSLALVGNHDLAAIGEISTADFSPLALVSAEWTAAAATSRHSTPTATAWSRNQPAAVWVESP